MIQTWVIMVHQFACCLNINVAIERRLLPSLHWRSRGKEGLAEMSQNRSSLEDHQHFRHLWEWLRTLNLCVLELRLFLGWSLYLLNLNSHNQSSKSATTRPRDSAIFCPMFTARSWIDRPYASTICLVMVKINNRSHFKKVNIYVKLSVCGNKVRYINYTKYPNHGL